MELDNIAVTAPATSAGPHIAAEKHAIIYYSTQPYIPRVYLDKPVYPELPGDEFRNNPIELAGYPLPNIVKAFGYTQGYFHFVKNYAYKGPHWKKRRVGIDKETNRPKPVPDGAVPIDDTRYMILVEGGEKMYYTLEETPDLLTSGRAVFTSRKSQNGLSYSRDFIREAIDAFLTWNLSGWPLDKKDFKEIAAHDDLH